MTSDPASRDSTRVRVRYAETDQMGRAHHMHYLAWFELGRTELLRQAGVAYSELEKEGIRLPVSNVEIDYRSPVGYDEVVEVFTRVSRVRSRTVTFSYLAARAGSGEALATGSTRLVCTNAEGSPRRISQHLIAVLESLMAAQFDWPDS